MNFEPNKNRLWKLIKRLEILCYLASAISIMGAIAPYPEMLSIALGAIGVYLVAQGICLRKLRKLWKSRG